MANPAKRTQTDGATNTKKPKKKKTRVGTSGETTPSTLSDNSTLDSGSSMSTSKVRKNVSVKMCCCRTDINVWYTHATDIIIG